MRLSVVVPVHGGADLLRRCLCALEGSALPADEIIVVDDGSPEAQAGAIARCVDSISRARLLRQAQAGPAAARNRGAQGATGDLLIFVDADVEVHPNTLGRFAAAFERDAGLAAVFGAYDDQPPGGTLVSDYRNLLHHWTHLHSRREATTFWAGCGAVRRAVFIESSGFDASFHRPSIEDVEFGLRLTAAGHRVELHPEIQGTHLKRWTLGSFLWTDLFQRALPWTQLLLERRGALPRDLNFGLSQRASVALAALAAVALPMLAVLPAIGTVVLGGSVLCLFAINLRFLGFLAETRGLAFACGAFPLHGAHYLMSAAGFLAGLVRAVHRRDPRLWVAGVVVAVAVFGMQFAGGAYATDFASHPDEAAHYVSGLMVSEYLQSPTGDPLGFAERYYTHYPKVAIGHWPPLFYFVEGAWFACFGPSRTAALVLQGWLAWLLVMCVYVLARRFSGPVPALTAALLLVGSPPFQASLVVMSDSMTALLVLVAAVVFERWAGRPNLWLSLGFGTVAALALLVKGSAIPLALVPVFTVVVTGRIALIGRGDFWASALPVLLMAVPWYVFAAGRFPSPDIAGFVWAGGRWSIWLDYGLVLLGLAMAGLRARPTGATAVVMAYLAAPLVVPSFQESRHLLPAAAAAAVLAGAALGRLPAPQWTAAGVAVLAVVVSPGLVRHGEGRFRSWVAGLDRPPGVVLAAGGAGTEGAVVAALAERWPRTDASVLRASKVLAASDWNGGHYRLVTPTAEAVGRELERRGVTTVAGDVDQDADVPHLRLLEAATRDWSVQPTRPVVIRIRAAGLLPGHGEQLNRAAARTSSGGFSGR